MLAPDLDLTLDSEEASEAAPFEVEQDALDAAFRDLLDSADGASAAADPAPTAEGAASAAGEQGAGRSGPQPVHGDAEGVDALLVLGEAYLGQGLAGEALERFEKARQLLEEERAADESAGGDESEYRTVLSGIVRSFLLLDRSAQALHAATRLHEIAPDDPGGMRLLARTLSGAGEHGRAVALLERATTRDPEAAPLWVELGEARLTAGDLAGAEEALRHAISLDGAAAAAHVALGRVLERTNRFDEAAQELSIALELLPSYGEAALALAEVERRRGRRQVAVDVLVDLLHTDPYHLEALTRLGETLLEMGRTEPAATAFRRVLRFDPDHAAARVGLGRTRRNLTEVA